MLELTQEQFGLETIGTILLTGFWHIKMPDDHRSQSFFFSAHLCVGFRNHFESIQTYHVKKHRIFVIVASRAPAMLVLCLRMFPCLK